MDSNNNNNSVKESKKVGGIDQTPVYVRKQKTLIVGPKKGLTAFLARCAAIAIVFIRIFTPISIGFLSVQTMISIFRNQRAFWSSRKPWKRLIAAAFGIEALFYVYMQSKLKRLQLKESENIPTMSAIDRRILFDRCMKSGGNPKHFLESWFEPVRPYSELCRGNIQELIAWSMFHKSDWRKEMSEAEKCQLEEMVSEIEVTLGSLKPGYLADAKILKFTDEPVEGKHRPLFMYGVVHGLFQVVMAPFQMRMAGYRNGQEGSLTYWYRPGRNPHLPPICFIHGIGIGILSYQHWFRVIEAMCDADTGGLAGRGILIPEIHVISQRLNPSELHCEHFVDEVKMALLKSSGHNQACFVGHSYGSFCVSWLIKRAPEMVGACGLIDPASVLLHNTEVLHNIVYHRALPNAVEATLDYIMRSEVSLVHNLKRQFYWFANVLFFEEIDTKSCPTFVCLGDTDQLVPIHEIKQYVENYNNQKFVDVPNAPHKPFAPIDLLWFERCDHAGYLFNAGFGTRVGEAIGRICERSDRMKETKV